MKNTDNIIVFSYTPNIRAGGPAGYIANLKFGLDEIKDTNVVVVAAPDNTKILSQKIKHFLCNFIPIRKLRRKTRNKILNKTYSHKYLEKRLDRYNFKTITCHIVDDVIWIREYLNRRGLNAKILQMSHSPSFPSIERFDALKNDDIKLAKRIRAEIATKEKQAFETADVIVAPAPESLDSYKQDADYFSDLLKSKSVKYVATGCKKLTTNLSQQQLRDKYNISTPFVISYIGRHIPVRGYDILKEIGASILKMRDDVTFLIGGAPDAHNPPLNHTRWIELGWVNPGDVLYASDLFVSPGRQAYFDLILLEVMSTGCLPFATNVQGNKSVSRQTHAIELFDTSAQAIEKILKYLDSTSSQRQKKRDAVNDAYQKNYTPQVFAKNYVKMIKEIINEK